MKMEEKDAPDEQAIVPVDVRQFAFYEDEITVVLLDIEGQRQVYVVLRPLCQYLGLSWSSQLQRIREDDVLTEGITSVLLSNTEVGHRQRYKMIGLKLELLPGWLFSFSPKRVRADLQDKIKRYRRECYRVLWNAFWRGELFPDELLPPPTTTIVEASNPLAVVVIEQHQEAMAGQGRIEAKLDHAVDLLTGFLTEQVGRINKIDERTQRLTPAHAQQISEAVDRLCQLWCKKSPGLTNDKAHSWAYHRIHQRFDAPSYKEIADERFDDVLAYVRKAIQRASDGTEPEQGSLFDS